MARSKKITYGQAVKFLLTHPQTRIYLGSLAMTAVLPLAKKLMNSRKFSSVVDTLKHKYEDIQSSTIRH